MRSIDCSIFGERQLFCYYLIVWARVGHWQFTETLNGNFTRHHQVDPIKANEIAD